MKYDFNLLCLFWLLKGGNFHIIAVNKFSVLLNDKVALKKTQTVFLILRKEQKISYCSLAWFHPIV